MPGKKSEDPIEIKPSREGLFTAKAKRMKMSVQAFAKHVMANPDHFDTATRKQAQFAINAKKWAK